MTNAIHPAHTLSSLNSDAHMRRVVSTCARAEGSGGCPAYPVPEGATPHPRRANWEATLSWSGLSLHECMGAEDYTFRYLVGAENLSADQVMYLERGTDHDVREYQAQRYLEEMRDLRD